MGYSISEFRNYKEVPDELIDFLRSELKSNWDDEHNIMEELEFEYEGFQYAFVDFEDSEWIDEGKYQYSDYTYQLVSYDKTKASYPCGKSIINNFNIFVAVPVSKSGSYFSDYFYNYDFPSIRTSSIIVVPEIIIPEHEEVKFVNK